MRTIDVEQGSAEWHEFRANRFTGSLAPAMMGLSPQLSRRELLRLIYTGDEKEISSFTRKIFDEGHRVEALARPLICERFGIDLFPLTGRAEDSGGGLGFAFGHSFDGVTMDERTIWECKQWNADKAAEASAGRIPDSDWPQVAHGFLVCDKAERAIYTVSDGTSAYTISVEVTREQMADQIEAVRRGWRQFIDDLATYEPPREESQSVGRTMESLPALRVEVTGEVTASNLAEYKQHALAVFGSINTDLQTDQDFADAEQAVKWCKDVEGRLDSAKENALAQTSSLDELFRTIDELSAEARRVRLDLDKRVKARKVEIRSEIRAEADRKLADHIRTIDERLGRRGLVQVDADFAGAMKGKRTVTTLRDAVDTELARAKIQASEIADQIGINLKAYEDHKGDFSALFPDMDQLVRKAPDDFLAAVKSRIADHQAAQERRREAEREKIRAEERERAEREAARKSAGPPPGAESAAPPPKVQSRAESSGIKFINYSVTVEFESPADARLSIAVVEDEIRRQLMQAGFPSNLSIRCRRNAGQPADAKASA